MNRNVDSDRKLYTQKVDLTHKIVFYCIILGVDRSNIPRTCLVQPGAIPRLSLFVVHALYMWLVRMVMLQVVVVYREGEEQHTC
jgi:hypothetical protein